MNDFYVGYHPRAPYSVSRFGRRAVAFAVCVGLAAATVLVFAQAPFAPSRFEFGQTRQFEGTVAMLPYPALLSASDRYLLIAPGKHGLGSELAALHGRQVRLRGSLIERPGERMVEVVPGNVDVVQSASIPTSETVLGPVTLAGEIVDTKCYFGVMNPGSGKVHRDCAVRCISGGIPPGLLVRDRDGMLRTVLLAGADGRELHREILDYVAEPVHIHGTLARVAGSLVLRAEPSDIVRE